MLQPRAPGGVPVTLRISRTTGFSRDGSLAGCSVFLGPVSVVQIQVFRPLLAHRDLLQGVNRLIVYGAEEEPVQSLYDHRLRALEVMLLHAAGVEHPVVAPVELDAVPAVHGFLRQDGVAIHDLFK